MIAPRARLIWLSALLLVPALTVLFAVPDWQIPATIVLLVSLLVAVADAVLLRPNFSGLRVSLPEVIRLGKDRAGKIDVKVAKGGPGPDRFYVGLAIPRDVGAETPEWKVEAPAESTQLFSILCQPKRRGRFALTNCYVKAATRLQLWDVRQALPVNSEIRVYPDLLADRRHISALFLRRGLLGFRQHRQVGKGREFEKLRDYISGDSAEDVHWKATAKRGRPVTKIFQIERTQEVYVIVDASRLSGRWSGGSTVLERFINSALILCLAASRQSDLFGLVTFTDKLQNFVRARNGKAHYDVCRDALYTLQPQAVSPDFEELFAFLRLRLRRRALLVFLTALDDPALAESFSDHVSLLTRQHVVLVNMVKPPEARPLFAADDVTELDQLYQRLGGQLLWAELQEIRKKLQSHGAEASLLTADELAPEAVNSYLRVKQRQLL